MKFSRPEFYDWARRTVKELEDHILLYESIENLSFSDLTMKEIKKLLNNIQTWLGVHIFMGIIWLIFLGLIWFLTWFLGGVFDVARVTELGDTSNSFILLIFWGVIWIFLLWVSAW